MEFPKYNPSQTYDWNYEHAPTEVKVPVPACPGQWEFFGRTVGSPLGVAAGPLLNGQWCLYYASLGFDVVTYKTVRSRERACYPLPNLVAVDCGTLQGGEAPVEAAAEMRGSWAVSFGMPSRPPDVWRRDVEETRRRLPAHKLLSVSVVGSVQEGWTIDDLAEDYALCARWAMESGADCVEANFSCPNVSTCDGQLYQHPDDAALVAAALRRAVGSAPLLLKIGHLPERDLAERLVAAVEPYVDGLAMTNSIAVQVRGPDGSLLFDGQRRGICGRATLEASVAQTRLVRQIITERRSRLALIGVGGARSATDVRAYLDAGAAAVHLATAAMTHPDVGLRIRADWDHI